MSIDPSYTKIGVAISNSIKNILYANTKYFKEKDTKKREKQIAAYILLLLQKFKPEKIVIEVPGYPWVRYGKNKKPVNLLPLKKLFMAIGLIKGVLLVAGYDYIDISPKEWKGNESKEITYFKYRDLFLNGNSVKRISNDTIDAVMLGVYYRQTYLKEEINA